MHSQFVIATGELTGFRLSGDQETRAANTPTGCAWIEGDLDPRHWAVQVLVDDFGSEYFHAVNRMPPKPADSAYQVWRWHEASSDWVASPTRLYREEAPRAERDRLLAASDWVVMRALETGVAVPAPWLAYRAALRALPEQPGFPDSIAWPVSPTA